MPVGMLRCAVLPAAGVREAWGGQGRDALPLPALEFGFGGGSSGSTRKTAPQRCHRCH